MIDSANDKQAVKHPLQNAKDIDLSVVVVTGNRQFENSKPFSAISTQSIASRMELILLNYNSAVPETTGSTQETGFPIRRLLMRKGESLLSARCRGYETSSGKVVAILEDHCVPDPNWGDSLIEHLSKNDGLVGYAFTNGSPDRYRYRSLFLAEYGFWMYPVVGEQAKYLPNNNISFKKQLIQNLQDQYKLELGDIFTFSPVLKELGVCFSVATDAVVEHQSYADIADVFRAHFHFSRVLGGSRFKQGSWKGVKKTLYAVSVPILLPILQLMRVATVVCRSSKTLLLEFIPGIPLIYFLFQFSAIGEMIGYLFGKGQSGQVLDEIELNASRIGKEP